MVGPARMSIISRFAPSPTGPLHLGHVYAALFAWRHARSSAGRFLLRMEDTDSERCRPGYARGILDDLAWLGLHWDGPVRIQSEHLAEYAGVLEGLRQRGLVYPCFCSRADILRAGAAPHGPEGALYPGTCRRMALAERAERTVAGQPHAWRLHAARAVHETGELTFMEEGQGRLACHPLAFGDVVLGRRGLAPSYHLCVTHDDALDDVSIVTRGVDLRPATAIHRLLQALMGWPEPGYAHHALLAGNDGRRLAKRDGATAVRALRDAGHGAATVIGLAMNAPRVA